MRYRNTTAILFMVLTAVPLLANRAMNHWGAGTYQINEVTEHNDIMANVVAHKVDALLQQPVLLLRQLVQDRASVMRRDTRFDKVVRRAGIFESIFLLDSNGRIIGSGLKQKSLKLHYDLIGKDLNGDGLIQINRKNPAAIWSDVASSIVSDNQILSVALDYDDGVIIGNIDVKWFADVVMKINQMPHFDIRIVDGSGTILQSNDPDFQTLGTNIGYFDTIKQALANGDTDYLVDVDGVKTIGSLAHIRSTGWLVLLQQGYDHALDQIDFWRPAFLGLLVISVIVAGIIGFWFAGWFLRPLLELQSWAGSSTNPESSLPWRKRPWREISDLHGVFESLLKKNRTHQHSLESFNRHLLDNLESLETLAAEYRQDGIASKEKNETLASVLTSMNEGVFAVDNLYRVFYCNEVGLKILGYSNAQDLLGQKICDLLTFPDEPAKTKRDDSCRMLSAIHTGGSIFHETINVVRDDGIAFKAIYSVTPLRKLDKVIGAVVTFEEVNDKPPMLAD